MRLRSEDWLGHSRTFNVLLLEPLLCCLGCVFWVIINFGIPIHDPFSMPCLASMPWPWWYMAPFIIPLMRCSCPVPLAEKHPQSIMFPPPCLTVGMVFLGSWTAFLLLQTRRVELMPKSWILVSSDHNTFTQFSSESLANFSRACTCAFLSRGTLRALQDFSPSWCSVTNCFLGDYGPSCLEIIHKILSCSSGLIPHRSHDHWNSTRRDLAWSPSPRKIDSYFVFLSFANNHTNCCHLLTKLLGDGLVAHSSLE